MPSQTKPPRDRLIGIDWGTSNRRAYLIDRAGHCLATHADDQGVLAARPHFAQSLGGLLARLGVGDDVPVVASGMIGSAQGWREAPYLGIGVPLDDLPEHLMPVRDEALARRCFLVPGYAQRATDAGGSIDVMRGEETQLLGAVALGRRDGWVVLPGTHSKWALLQNGVIQRFATYMTGELFALLGAQGTLAPLMGERDDPDMDGVFEAGVLEARGGAPLSHALFGVRARVVAGAMPAAHTRAFLSGLLIGAEYAAFAVQRSDDRPVLAIGTPALCARHARAASMFGIAVTPLDPDRAYCAALACLYAGAVA